MAEVSLNRRSLAEADLPVYPGVLLQQVILVDRAEKAVAAQAALLAQAVIGFDSESKPTFRKGEVSTGPHLIQLATAEQVYLLPTVHDFNRTILQGILSAESVLKVGFGLGNDRSALLSRFGIELRPVLDLGEVLRGTGHRGTVGAKVAVAHFFGQKLHKSKKLGTSNWASASLSERQILYAANDARVALDIYKVWTAERSARKIHPSHS